MLYKETKNQCIFLLKQKEVLITVVLLMTMVLTHYIRNINEFQGMDLVEMYYPMKMLLLSYNYTYYQADAMIFFVQIYPLLVVLPVGFSLQRERQSGMDVYLVARLGHKIYKLSRVLASFIVTFIVFSFPFLLEIVMYCIAFPMDAIGDLSKQNTFSLAYHEMLEQYIFSDLFIENAFLYTVLCIFLFALISGLLASISVILCAIIRFKYKAFVFIPAFLFLSMTMYLGGIFEVKNSLVWYDYLLLFNEQAKSEALYVLFIMISMLTIAILTWYSLRKDKYVL